MDRVEMYCHKLISILTTCNENIFIKLKLGTTIGSTFMNIPSYGINVDDNQMKKPKTYE